MKNVMRIYTAIYRISSKKYEFHKKCGWCGRYNHSVSTPAGGYRKEPARHHAGTSAGRLLAHGRVPSYTGKHPATGRPI